MIKNTYETMLGCFMWCPYTQTSCSHDFFTHVLWTFCTLICKNILIQTPSCILDTFYHKMWIFLLIKAKREDTLYSHNSLATGLLIAYFCNVN